MSTATRRSCCNRDCPDACGLVATIENGRIIALQGDPEHPVTRGFLCHRTGRFPARLEAAERLTRPLLRRGQELVEVSMDEALNLAARRLLDIRQQSGPAAIFHYRSGGSLGQLKIVADRFFEQFGPCTGKAGNICSGAGKTAQQLDFGVSDSNDFFDLDHSRNIICWGKNPTISSVHLVTLLERARDRGARIALIDPVHHRGTAYADRFWQLRPGGDLDLALGIARVLFEEELLDVRVAESCENLESFRALVMRRSLDEYAAGADVEPVALHELALMFADGPTAIVVGWGMQRRSHGGSIVRALDALSAISGNLFVPGGGCSFYFASGSAFDKAAFTGGAMARTIREPMFAADVRAARDPEIRAIWITAGNPVCMLPDSAAVAEAIEATEFVVVVDPFLTDTGRRADLILPVPTLCEDSDLLGAYGHHWLAESRPLVEPPPGVLHEVDLLAALGARVGLKVEMSGTVDDHKRRLLSKVAQHGVTLESLRQGARRNPLAAEQIFTDGRVATPSGKIRLMTEVAEMTDPPKTEDDYPLWLMSNATVKSQSSQWVEPLGGRIEVTVHPDTLPGGVAGEAVVVDSEIGSLLAKLRLDPKQRTDVALLPKGGHYDRGQSANVLVAARATDIGLGAAILDCRVRVRRP